MEDEVVRRRKWMTRERFLDLLARRTSFQVRNRRRWPSTSATCARDGAAPGRRKLSYPSAALIVSGIAGLRRFGTLAQALAVLYGINPSSSPWCPGPLGTGQGGGEDRFLGFVAVGALAAQPTGRSTSSRSCSPRHRRRFLALGDGAEARGVSGSCRCSGRPRRRPGRRRRYIRARRSSSLSLKIGSDAVRERLCPAGISPGGPRRTARMADEAHFSMRSRSGR